MVLRQTLVQFFVLLTNLLDLALLVILDLSDLTLQFINFLLLLFSMFCPFLPQMNELVVAVCLGLLQGIYLGLKVLNHLCVRLLLLSSRCQHLLHYYFVI